MSRMRADLLLVARGLFERRAKARAPIEAGGVFAAGRAVSAASDMLAPDAPIEARPAHPWVSRGGLKLAHALDAFAVDPAGRVCLDVGASTGGFTDVLLARGARAVCAVDVGAGQLHARLRADRRVRAYENLDARHLSRTHLPEAPSFIACDVSFIGAAKALAAPLALAAPRADLIVLIKPQFEAGPGAAGKDGVLDIEVARRAASQAMAGLEGLEGFCRVAECESPVRGGSGNIEFLMHARR